MPVIALEIEYNQCNRTIICMSYFKSSIIIARYSNKEIVLLYIEGLRK